MKRILLFVVVASLLLVAFAILRGPSRSTNQLNVDPNAAGEIEKAKGR